MGIQFGGVSADEIKEDGGGGFKLMPENEPFEMDVIDCEEAVSKSGNAMFKITLQPTATEWESRKLWDYIVGGEWFDKKMGNILASAGKDFTRGRDIEVDDIVGLRVTVKLKHEEYNDKTSEKVSFYVPKSKVIQAPIQQEQATIVDDGGPVPF